MPPRSATVLPFSNTSRKQTQIEGLQSPMAIIIKWLAQSGVHRVSRVRKRMEVSGGLMLS